MSNNVYRHLDIELILLDYTVDNLRQVYADALIMPVKEVYGKLTERTLTFTTRSQLSPSLRGELGDIASFTVSSMFVLDREQSHMFLVSFDKSCYTPLFDAFTGLVGEARRKKLNHLL